jgi:hypothetical protein
VVPSCHRFLDLCEFSYDDIIRYVEAYSCAPTDLLPAAFVDLAWRRFVRGLPAIVSHNVSRDAIARVLNALTTTSPVSVQINSPIHLSAFASGGY